MALFKDKLPVREGKKLAWAKRANESFEQFNLFQDFLKSQSRSLDELAEQKKLQKAFIQNLCKDFDWIERAAAYDFHNLEQQTNLEVQLIPAKETTLANMHEKHMALASKAQQVAAVGFKLIENYVKEYEYAREHGEDAPPKPALKPEDIVKMARFGVEAERMALGQATKIVETKTDYTKLSTEKLELLESLLAEAEDENDE